MLAVTPLQAVHLGQAGPIDAADRLVFRRQPALPLPGETARVLGVDDLPGIRRILHDAPRAIFDGPSTCAQGEAEVGVRDPGPVAFVQAPGSDESRPRHQKATSRDRRHASGTADVGGVGGRARVERERPRPERQVSAPERHAGVGHGAIGTQALAPHGPGGGQAARRLQQRVEPAALGARARVQEREVPSSRVARAEVPRRGKTQWLAAGEETDSAGPIPGFTGGGGAQHDEDLVGRRRGLPAQPLRRRAGPLLVVGGDDDRALGRRRRGERAQREGGGGKLLELVRGEVGDGEPAHARGGPGPVEGEDEPLDGGVGDRTQHGHVVAERSQELDQLAASVALEGHVRGAGAQGLDEPLDAASRGRGRDEQAVEAEEGPHRREQWARIHDAPEHVTEDHGIEGLGEGVARRGIAKDGIEIVSALGRVPGQVDRDDAAAGKPALDRVTDPARPPRDFEDMGGPRRDQGDELLPGVQGLTHLCESAPGVNRCGSGVRPGAGNSLKRNARLNAMVTAAAAGQSVTRVSAGRRQQWYYCGPFR